MTRMAGTRLVLHVRTLVTPARPTKKNNKENCNKKKTSELKWCFLSFKQTLPKIILAIYYYTGLFS